MRYYRIYLLITDINRGIFATGPSGVEPETAGFLPYELKVRYSTWLSYGPIR